MAIPTPGDSDTPLIPDIAGLSKIICDRLAKDAKCKPLFAIIEDHFAEDECASVTVEDMLTHIRALRAVAGKATVRGLTAADLDKLDETICAYIHETADKQLPGRDTPYHHVASWVDAVRRATPIEIFTTNYDLLMEQAFEDRSVTYFDGFTGARNPFFDLRALEEDQLPPRWARLWKLHGSINWYQIAGKGVFRGTVNSDMASKHVIHPSHLKYEESRRLPYLAMMDRFRAFLRQPTPTLVLCGYSFRDDHINEVIVQGLQSTQTSIAFALLYGSITEYPQAIELALKRPNLSLLARDGAVVSAQRSIWPEKDAEAVPRDNQVGAKWMPCDPTKKDGKWTAEFTLGDFAVLGQFFDELVGTVRVITERSK